ncbi:MAG: pilus assembly protein PilM [bacterium]
MSLFAPSQPSYLGIDIGLGGIKIAEMRNNKGRAQLLTYGFSEESSENTHEEYFADTERLSAIIKSICEQANTASKHVVASLPTYTVFDSIITLPFMPAQKLKSAIEAEAKKLISRPLEEMALYWNILKQEDENNKTQKHNPSAGGTKILKKTDNEKDIILSQKTKYLKIFLTAAPKDFINTYVKIFQNAGLRLISLETAAFALARSLAGMDKSHLLIADVGAKTTEIIILDQGLPVFSRSINLGGFQITKAFQESLKVSQEEAEQIKIDLSANKDSQSLEIIKISEKILAPIVDEIKYSINLYFNRLSLENTTKKVGKQEDEKRIEKIILAGGNSLLAGFNDYIKTEMATRVFIGDPWARVIYPQDLRPLLDEIGPKFSIAVGLGMREIN